MQFEVKTPRIPIPFHKLLKIVAIVDGEDAEIRPLLERLKAEKFEVEVSDRYLRDVSEDAAVGAYIVALDGERLDPARRLAQAVRGLGFRTPLRALADFRLKLTRLFHRATDPPFLRRHLECPQLPSNWAGQSSVENREGMAQSSMKINSLIRPVESLHRHR